MAQGSTVNLAVTGLSRSGKTVFITSLIHNLLSAVHNPNRMPLLSVVGNGRLLGARLESAGAGRLPRFRYQENIEAMAAGAPSGPRGTDDLREIGIEIRFMPANAPGKLLSEISGSPATITLRIVDYPGEWLLDLPLLDQSYAEWSRATLRLYRQRRARRGGRRIPRLHRAAPPRRGGERGDRQAGARPLPRLPGQGARCAWAEPSAAGPLPVSGQSRRCAVPLVRAARRAGQRDHRAEHARRADGGALRRLQARGGRRASTRITSAGSRARSCWSTCCARCSPAARRSRTSGWRSSAILQSFRYGSGSICSRS